MLDTEMKRVVDEQRLGYVATVGPDGTPNLSPKGTTAVWDDEHLVFAHLHSHQTVANIEAGHPTVEINIVDPIRRKGYRFKGTATVHRQGAVYESGLDFYHRRSGLDPSRVAAIVLVRVDRAAPIISPAYDDGSTEEEVEQRSLLLYGLRRVEISHKRGTGVVNQVMTTNVDVIVIGGGLAGLAAGVAATRGGASTLVLEAHHPGGRARTTERDGFIFNHGAHALYVGGPGMQVLGTLGVRPGGTAPPVNRYRVLFDGEQHILPSGPGSLLRTTCLGARDKAQFGKLLALLPRLDARTLVGRSVSDWLRGHDLRPRVDALTRAFFRLATYAADFDELGADAAVVQLQLAAKSGVIYVDGGWAQLIDALHARVRVRTGAAARRVESDAGRVTVHTDDGAFTARAAVLAPGAPDALRGLLPTGPGWGDLGEPVTAACLDVGVRRAPSPGYVLGMDEPLYGTTQSPPARQTTADGAVVGVIRYGARTAEQDRPQLDAHLGQVGVSEDDVVVTRFLAWMVVAGAMPRAATGGLAGRPDIGATGLPDVFAAGDWIGPDGLLADAALASGHAAGLAALRAIDASSTMVA